MLEVFEAARGARGVPWAGKRGIAAAAAFRRLLGRRGWEGGRGAGGVEAAGGTSSEALSRTTSYPPSSAQNGGRQTAMTAAWKGVATSPAGSTMVHACSERLTPLKP